MLIAAAVTAFGFLLLFLISLRIPAAKRCGPIRRVALLLSVGGRRDPAGNPMPLWKVSGQGEKSAWEERVLKDLDKLYPGRDRERTFLEYRVKKLSLTITVILAGTALAAAVSWQAGKSGHLLEGDTIERGSCLEDGYRLNLQASVEGYGEQDFSLEINGTVPDRERADALETEFWAKLEKEALGKNASWDRVYEDLRLAENIEGYPFRVEWESATPALVDSQGIVRRPVKDATAETVLTATVLYHVWEWRHTLPVTVVAYLSEEERFHEELERYLVELEEKERQNERVRLPDSLEGREIVWREPLEDYGLLLWMLALTAGVGIYFLQDRDLEAKARARQKLMKGDYPGLVRKLTLYLGAGLTVRGALLKIADKYAQALADGGKTRPAYEEILRTCRELKLGEAEPVAYERFGTRCALQEYVRLGALLSQNAVKGSGGLARRLNEEAEAAVKEQLQQCRQLGEEASTKLLFPMVMMLGIVMVMIMIPAFGIV